MYGDIKLSDFFHLVRSLKCNDLSAGKKIASAYQDKNWCRFAILIDELPICVFGRYEILGSRPIEMDQYSITNVKNPADRLHAVNKGYDDRLKYKTATGNIHCHDSTYTLHISRCDSFCQWKDKNMWDVAWTVDRWLDCNIKSNVRYCVAYLSQICKRSVHYDILH